MDVLLGFEILRQMGVAIYRHPIRLRPGHRLQGRREPGFGLPRQTVDEVHRHRTETGAACGGDQLRQCSGSCIRFIACCTRGSKSWKP